MERLIRKQEFLKLAAIREPNCVSIYIPTERAGEASYQKQGRIILKNSIQHVNKKLTEAGLSDQQISAIIEKVSPLRDYDRIWRDQSDGLAIFINKEDIYHYSLPLSFKEEVYVEDHFYLLPILPYFNDDGTFYLMSLSQQNVQLFECSRHFITEIDVTDLVPGRLEYAVGSDYRQKSLQHRSGQAGHGRAMYHGQGAGKDDSEIETKKFFRDVDRGIFSLLGSENDPLVLACVEAHYPVYKEISSYPHIYDDFLHGNFEQEDPLLLHEKAWELVKDHFRMKRKSLRTQFQNLSSNDKTITDLEEIVTASTDGRVHALFIQKGKNRFGHFDPNRRKVSVEPSPDTGKRTSLFNMAAINTLLTGGEAFLNEAEEMPHAETEINALLRF